MNQKGDEGQKTRGFRQREGTGGGRFSRKPCGSRPRAPCRRGAAFPALRDSSGADPGAIWVVPRIFPSHGAGKSYFFARRSGSAGNAGRLSFSILPGPNGTNWGKIIYCLKISFHGLNFPPVGGYYGRTFQRADHGTGNAFFSGAGPGRYGRKWREKSV
jgi:hypothetical protein